MIPDSSPFSANQRHRRFPAFFSALIAGSWLLVAATLSAMDLVRVESRIDDAIARFGVTGQGVIVALLDRGIDWKNNDFRNADGTTRIKYIYDLTDPTGAFAPGNPYGRGTIFTEAQTNAALTSGPLIATRDAVGHGTRTAGIPTGNGRNVAKYRGVAVNATIIVVKVTSTGAPAHDGEAAEPVFNDSTAYPVAIDFVVAKASELGLPAVMLLNLGSVLGPTDGTSSLARKIDSVTGPTNPGIIFVTGPSDDGGAPNRAGGTVPIGGSITLSITKVAGTTPIMDLWYPVGTDAGLTVTIQTPGGTFGPYAPPASEGIRITQQSAGQFTMYHNGANVEFFGATSNTRELYVLLQGAAGTYNITLALPANATIVKRFDATLNPSNLSTANAFTTFLAPGSIWDAATAFNNVSPGDYVIRTGWTDIDGFARTNLGQGNPGQIWTGSGIGPTFDGRLGVDLAAPGDSLFTTENPKAYSATFRFNMIQDGLGFYGRASAVSAAAPVVTGTIALMLQMNPKLNSTAVKSVLQASARADGSTGAVPNTTWGYGKLDAYAALEKLEMRVTSANRVGNDIQFHFKSVVGLSYRADYRADLFAGTWLPLFSGMAGTGSEITVTDPAAIAQGQRFYRVVVE